MSRLPGVRRAPIRRAARCGQGGFTLVEILLAAVVITIGVGSVMTLALQTSKLQQATQEYAKAHNICRDILEKMRNGNLTTQFQTYKAAPQFTVGDQTVTVTFPESFLVQSLGAPVAATARFRDMNADGQVDLDAASTEQASLVPVCVTVVRRGNRMQMLGLVTDR